MSDAKRLWQLAFAASLALVFLWLAAPGVSWTEIGLALRSADYGLVAVAVVLVVLGTTLRAWCWRRLLGPTPQQITFTRAWRILLVAQLLNVSMPARAGDVARVYLIGEAGRFAKSSAAASLIVEKFLDMTALLFVLFTISIQIVLPPILENARVVLATATIALALIVVMVVWHADRFGPRLSRYADGTSGWLGWVLDQFVLTLDGVKVLRRWPMMVGIQCGYVGVWAALGLSTYVMFAAVNLDLPPVAALVVLAVVQLGTAVPSTPGKVGVFQFLSVLALGPFGVADGAAFTYGILLHFVSYGPVIVCGGIGLWLELPSLRRAGVIQRRSAITA